VVVREDVPETAANEIGDLAVAVHGFLVPSPANFVERRLRPGRAVAGGAGQPLEVTVSAQRLSVDLFDRRMEDCQEGRALPALRRDLCDHVVAGESKREKPVEEHHAPAVAESHAMATNAPGAAIGATRPEDPITSRRA
jgi:hypothetical protein